MKRIFLLILVVGACPFLNAQVMFGNVEYNKVLNFHSNYLTFSKPIEVTALGKKRQSIPCPLTLNGEKIYSFMSPNVKPAQPVGFNLPDYVFNSIKPDLEKLPDGEYILQLMNLVLDKKGKLAYFDFDTLKILSGNVKTFSYTTDNLPDEDQHTLTVQDLIDNMGLRDTQPRTAQSDSLDKVLMDIPRKTKLAIYLSLYKALKRLPNFTPAEKTGQKINYVLRPGYDFAIRSSFVIKNHKAALLKLSSQ